MNEFRNQCSRIEKNVVGDVCFYKVFIRFPFWIDIHKARDNNYLLKKRFYNTSENHII